MTTHNGRPDVKEKVKERYARIALVDNSDCCCMPGECGAETQTYFSSASEAALAIGYDENELKSVPATSILGVGCGAPLNFAGISEGEVIVDLGSGAGIDVFLSANRVGKGGKVIGIDMTDEMLEKARKNAKDHGYANVEFRKGDIEKRIPVENDSADLVISNCVINLTTNKVDAFKEVHRVLKRGGRMVISDLVADAEVAPDTANAEKWCSCIDGALTKENYLDSIRKAGFQNVVEVLSERLYMEGKEVDGRKITSVVIEAVKE
jgi:ubiquinone/menaquinone biosynthesis C-methylase UbiE